jgi:hypothetical protein
MGGIEKRLAALVEALSPGCPECGSGAQAPRAYEVVWADPEEEAAPEFCPHCSSEQLTFYVEWGDIEDQEERRTWKARFPAPGTSPRKGR